ncbi:hypothetical protein ACFE04_015269 [Oxalis oulophora]
MASWEKGYGAGRFEGCSDLERFSRLIPRKLSIVQEWKFSSERFFLMNDLSSIFLFFYLSIRGKVAFEAHKAHLTKHSIKNLFSDICTNSLTYFRGHSRNLASRNSRLVRNATVKALISKAKASVISSYSAKTPFIQFKAWQKPYPYIISG